MAETGVYRDNADIAGLGFQPSTSAWRYGDRFESISKNHLTLSKR
jgi:hypothetical protein